VAAAPKRRWLSNCSPISRRFLIRRPATCRLQPLPTAPRSSECSQRRNTMGRKPCRACPIFWPPGPSTDTTTALKNSRKRLAGSRGFAPGRYFQPEISVRDERENQPPTQGSAVWQQQIGLISGASSHDTGHDSCGYGPWKGRVESLGTDRAGPCGSLSVSVPNSASHFELISTLEREAAIEGFASPGGSRGIASIGVRPNNAPSRTSILRIRPAYQDRFGWTRKPERFSASPWRRS